jgi:hypothetical protein
MCTNDHRAYGSWTVRCPVDEIPIGRWLLSPIPWQERTTPTGNKGYGLPVARSAI